MQVGRLDEETTANVGRIEGGTSANVVAERCVVELEARSLDVAKAGEAVSAMRSLAQQHGLFVGPSSGANLIAARKVREAYPELETIVTLFCDEGEKYIQDHFADEVRFTSETFT